MEVGFGIVLTVFTLHALLVAEGGRGVLDRFCRQSLYCSATQDSLIGEYLNSLRLPHWAIEEKMELKLQHTGGIERIHPVGNRDVSSRQTGISAG